MQNKIPRKISIISPSLNMGGIECALVVLANHFAKKGCRVAFISCLSGSHFYTLNPAIKLVENSNKRKTGYLNAIIFYLKLCLFIRKKIMEIDPQTVLVFGDWFSPLVLLALYKTKFPVYISDRTSPDYKLRFPIPWLKRWLYPKSAGFIAQTQRAALYKYSMFGNRLNIRVIPSAIREVILFPKISREKIILYVGRFAWEKGPERLIRAFRPVAQRYDWQLHMAGSGPLLDSMKQLSAELNIRNQVVFYDKVREIDILYAKASIYVLPSLIEGFPNSLCEAMAAGLPCICFESIPHEEIFVNVNQGIVIPDDDLGKLTNVLVQLIENKEFRDQLGTIAKAIRTRLNVESIGDQVKNFIFEK